MKIATHQAELTAIFAKNLKSNAAQVVNCTRSNLPGLIHSFLVDQGLEKRILTGLEIDLTDESIETVSGPATGNELVGLSEAMLGISETGTLVLASSPTNPTSINYLVDYHLVLIHESNIVENLGIAIAQFQKEIGDSRALNLISGPSRTADIEQTIQLGAHGPRHLRVFIISSE